MNITRLIVASILIPLLYLYITCLPVEFIFVLVFVISSLALYEFYIMYKIPLTFSLVGIAMGGVMFTVSYCYPDRLPDTIFLCLFIIMGIRLFSIKTPEGSMKIISNLVHGLFYVSGFAIFLLLILRDFPDYGRYYIIIILFSVWTSDAMAYYVGKSLGKKKLYPSISPNKTVAGACASVAGGCICATLLNFIYSDIALTTTTSMIIGIIIGSASIVGDLIESMFKRDAGIKDSSSIIPGHGGFLDKLDSILIAGPLVYLFLRYV
jgi:phosphatidate cytidylyltransferase